ncbi:AAA family ATPase [Luteibacter sp. 3190]|uniref:AAA family ATPase n=1 Tax=Luteibacter sp. 3190 TaxID=2817736 RepID=UPI002860D544|nr:AAA family ATPase [Luteibacter sp. 3190]MDR6935332.1 ATP-dependent Clp protease ATP-binding subunit ClpX [Luteibacter sp. 3190]
MMTEVARMDARQHITSSAEIKSRFDSYMLGNEEAKTYLASIAFKHVLATRLGFIEGSRSHVLILGQTGVGKSYLVSSLRDILDVPVVTIDATTITEAGYQGRDVDSIFEDVLQAAGFDRMKAEVAVVFIDEFDKICAQAGGERDIRGRGVQYSLLKILDGDVRQIRSSRVSRLQSGSSGDVYQFNTKRMLFIFAGSFSAHPGLMQRDVISPADIANLGFLQELVARIPNIIRFDNLSAGDLESVITRAGTGVLREYAEIFESLGCSVTFSVDAKAKISEHVIDMGIGYRGLRTVLDRIFLPKLSCFESCGSNDGAWVPRFVVDYSGSEFVIKREPGRPDAHDQS